MTLSSNLTAALTALLALEEPELYCGNITRGSLVFIDSLCLPLYPCPDAAHAEAAGAAAAVLLAAKHYPILRPNHILIKGDNRAVIDFMTHTGKYRRPDLQQALQEAHHLLAFRPYLLVLGATLLANSTNVQTFSPELPVTMPASS